MPTAMVSNRSDLAHHAAVLRPVVMARTGMDGRRDQSGGTQKSNQLFLHCSSLLVVESFGSRFGAIYRRALCCHWEWQETHAVWSSAKAADASSQSDFSAAAMTALALASSRLS